MYVYSSLHTSANIALILVSYNAMNYNTIFTVLFIDISGFEYKRLVSLIRNIRNHVQL